MHQGKVVSSRFEHEFPKVFWGVCLFVTYACEISIKATITFLYFKWQGTIWEWKKNPVGSLGEQQFALSVFVKFNILSGYFTWQRIRNIPRTMQILQISLSLFVNWQPSRSQLETPASDWLFKLFLDEDKIIYNNLIYKHNLYIHSYNIVFSLFATDRIEGIQDRSIVSYISTVSVQVSQFRFGFIIDSETWCMGGLPVCDLQTCIISERTFSFLL